MAGPASAVLLFLFMLTGATPTVAQQARDTVRWWAGAAALGGLAVTSAFDEALQHATQEARTPTGDRLAAVARRMGQPEVFATIPAALFLGGLVSHRPEVRRAGERIAASLLLAGALAVGTKAALGRVRPFASEEPYDFRPFSGADAFPSGHTTMAFALATALADEAGRPAVTLALFLAASATGWSRLNDNKHWLSDVFAGAALGITSARLEERRWTVLHFHIRPPIVLAMGARMGIGWAVPLELRAPSQRFRL